MNYQECIEYLRQSPLFAMSLGSKELFHTNFWEWIINNCKAGKELVLVFFNDFDLSSYKEVVREDGNKGNSRDLTIYTTDGKEYVVENKIKSYPNKNQLRRYMEFGNFNFGAITGIKEPPFKLEKWTFVSYAEISNKVKDIAKEETNILYKEVLNEYSIVLDYINFLIEKSLYITDGRLSYWSDEIKLLNDIRLMDVFRKIKADDFTSFASPTIDSLLNSKEIEKFGIYTKFDRSFHNGKATIDYRLCKDFNNNWIASAGVQIEDQQFRIYLEIKDSNVSRTFDIGINLGWFDGSFDKKNSRKIKGYYTSMSKNPCQYSNCFVYQYFDLWNKNGQNLESYDDVLKMIKKYLVDAVEVLKRI